MDRMFFVRMKLLHNKNGRQSFYYRYFRWILWFCLSFYFFTSYLLSSSDKTISFPKTKLSTAKGNSISRALFESNATVLHRKPISARASVSSGLNDLKVYIYDLPSKYNADWLTNKRCSNHLFASEVAIHKALMESEVRTLDPSEADFFFVPVYVSCNFSTVNGFPALGHARSLLLSAVQLISVQMPYWNRSSGADHIFVASHDYGACFHAMEEVAVAHGIPEFLKKSIILQTFGVEYRHPCQEVENVLIPPYIPPNTIESTLRGMGPNVVSRDIWAFFRGKMEVNPKNVSGHYYSKKVRTVIWRKFNRNKEFYLQRHRFDGYQTEIRRSTFCLCPLGWAPWSPRLVESIALGCVPVIIADGIRLPFPQAIPWQDVSLRVAENDVGNLASILEEVALTNLTTIQANLWNPLNTRALMFNNPMQQGDATWHVLHSLSQKLYRSYRRISKYQASSSTGLVLH